VSHYSTGLTRELVDLAMADKKTPTFYIFHGEDDLSIDEAVAKLRAEMGDDANADLNINEIEGTEVNAPEVISAVSAYPFLADRRLVIVRGFIGWITRKGAGQPGKQAVQQLEENLPNLPDYARLVFVERGALSEKNAVIKFAQELDNGYVHRFGVPRDMVGWIKKRAKSEYGREIQPQAANALAGVIGEDLRRADNELIKLVSYVEEDHPITEEDVAAMTPYVPEANIFQMVDAIADGRGQIALELMHRLMSDKNQDPFGIYGMIVRQFRLLLQAKEHLALGGSPGGVAKAIGVRPFVAQNLNRQARGFTLEDLERIYRALQESDLKMKTGRIDPQLALDLFVASITR